MVRLRRLFDRITDTAIEELSIELGEQRLDSTHIRSNISRKGRCGLIADVLRCLLRDMQRRTAASFTALSAPLRHWFAGDDPIGEATKGYPERMEILGLWLAEALDVARTETDLVQLESFAIARRAFEQNYRMTTDDGGDSGPPKSMLPTSDSKSPIRTRRAPTGGKHSLQSAYAPDATIGHKGGGYHVQIAETCSNVGTEIITDFMLTEAGPDQDQAVPAVERLQLGNRLPSILYADAGYGNGNSLTRCTERGVTLYSPAPRGRSKDKTLGRDKFEFDDNGLVTACPAGHAPVRHGDRRSTRLRKGKAPHAYFEAAHCSACPLQSTCSIRPPENRRSGCYQIEIRLEQIARDQQLTEQRTEPFKTRLRIRAGIEATNSELKRAHGLGVLRVRRRLRVRAKVAFKVIACNTKRWLRAKLATNVRQPFSRRVERLPTRTSRRHAGATPNRNREGGERRIATGRRGVVNEAQFLLRNH
ncbi:MAG: hypothetical protein ACJAYU_001354 [Bradymonadia bacterium]|jgi:hypothetical protein